MFFVHRGTLLLHKQSLRETCRAFEVEAKSETLCNVTAVMTSASGIEESMNASSRADEPDALIGKDDKSMKREANNLMNVERTLLKKPKTMEINVDGKMLTVFCKN